MTITAGSLVGANRIAAGTLRVLALGGSNMKGTASGACPWTKAAGHTYWTTRVDETNLVNTASFPTNFGVAVAFMEAARAAGVVTMTMVEHGIAGAGLSTINSTFAAQGITHCGTASIRPNLILVYAGSNDASTGGATAAAAYTNAQGLGDDLRNRYGGGVAIIFGGLHTPDAGWGAQDEIVNNHLRDLAEDSYLVRSTKWFDNQDAAIIGGGNDHLTGTATGGIATTGARFWELASAIVELG